MALAEVKDRIAGVERQQLADAVATHGDTLRGWWACVGSPGTSRVIHDSGADLEAGLQQADHLADEASAAVIVQIPGDVSASTRALIGLLCGVDASQITPPALSDADWMLHCADIRDTQTTLRDRLGDAIDIVEPSIAATAGLLLGLAARRTPALLIGTHAHAAAVVAQRQSIAAVSWWRSAFSGSDPLLRRAHERLQLEPWITVGTNLSDDAMVDIVVALVTDLQQ